MKSQHLSKIAGNLDRRPIVVVGWMDHNLVDQRSDLVSGFGREFALQRRLEVAEPLVEELGHVR